MNKYLCFFAACLMTGLLQAQLTNPGFEQWQTDPDFNLLVPEGWTSLGFVGCVGEMPIAEQNPKALEGQYAANISTQYAGFAGTPMPGWLFSGDYYYDHNHNRILRGVPISHKPEYLSFAYQYETQVTQQWGEVMVEVFSGNTVLGSAKGTLRPTHGQWQVQNLRISYDPSRLLPDRILIQFFSNPTDGSPVEFATLSVDQVNLEYTSAPPCEPQFAAAYDAAAQALHVFYEGCDHGYSEFGFCATGLTEKELKELSQMAQPYDRIEVLDLQGRLRVSAPFDPQKYKQIIQPVSLEVGLYVVRLTRSSSNGKAPNPKQVKISVGL